MTTTATNARLFAYYLPQSKIGGGRGSSVQEAQLDMTDVVLMMTPDELRDLRDCLYQPARQDLDYLADRAGLLKTRRGPFHVTVDPSQFETFFADVGIPEIDHIDEDDLARLRRDFGLPDQNRRPSL